MKQFVVSLEKCESLAVILVRNLKLFLSCCPKSTLINSNLPAFPNLLQPSPHLGSEWTHPSASWEKLNFVSLSKCLLASLLLMLPTTLAPGISPHCSQVPSSNSKSCDSLRRQAASHLGYFAHAALFLEYISPLNLPDKAYLLFSLFLAIFYSLQDISSLTRIEPRPLAV